MEQQKKNNKNKNQNIIAVQKQENEGTAENYGNLSEALLEENVQRSSSIGNSSQSSSASSTTLDFEICRLCEKQVAVEKFREHSAACLIGNELAFRASALDEEITQLVEDLDSSIYWTSSVWLRNSATISPSILTPVTPFLSNSGVISLSMPTPTLGAIALLQEKKDVPLLSEGEFSLIRNISKVAHQVIKIKMFSRDTIEKLTIFLKEFQQFFSPLNQNKFTEKSKQMCTKLQKLIEQKRDQYLSSFSACEALWPPFEVDSVEYFQIAAQSFQARYSDVIPSLEDFELIKPISKGAFGQVFLCRKKRTGDLFAMKVQKKEHIMRKQNVNRIEEEHTILRKTFNPFIVKLFYSFQTDEHLYLVLEYLPGGDCLSLLEHVGYLEESTAKMYIAELLLALDYLHGHGIVHRDLKPDNMLISADGHIKLTDFGLSAWGVHESAVQYQQTSNLVFGKSGAIAESVFSSGSVTSNISTPSLSSNSSQQHFAHSILSLNNSSNNSNNNNNVPSPIPSKQSAISTPLIKSAASKTPLVPLTTRRQKALSIVGTPDYLAPEVLRGTGYGESADFWSVGIILYEFLVGVTPFASHSPEEVFAKALDENTQPFWPSDIDVSKEAKDLISKLLVRDPKKRLGSQGGVKEIKAHPFFADVKWDMLLDKKTEPPFKPQLQTKEDTTYFDSRETSHPSVNIEAELSQMKIGEITQEQQTKKTSPNLNSPKYAQKKKAPNFRNFFFRNLIHLNEANEAIAERKIQHRASSVSVLQTKRRHTREKTSNSSPPRVFEEFEKEKAKKEKTPLKIPSIRELKERSKTEKEEKSKSTSPTSSPATPNVLAPLAANTVGALAEAAVSPLNLLVHLKKNKEEPEKEKGEEESCFGKCDSHSVATAMYPHLHLHHDENTEKALGNVQSSPATAAFHNLRHLLSNKNRNYSI